MKQISTCFRNAAKLWLGYLFAFFLFLTTLTNFASAQSNSIRRAISPNQPMWLWHIDTWNYPDPQKIIDLIPKDIRPYVVMDISLSINHDPSTGRFKVVEYGFETAKSWIKVCAQNRMWAMIQPASGGMTQFPDSSSALFEYFFKNYPNFLGFNYAEQFWGFDDNSDPVSTPWTKRYAHFTDLLALSHKYGGYLVISWCGNQWSPSINPIGMLKRNPAFAQACTNYSDNFILCEKYTTQSYKNDIESVSLGAFLSGYSGHYGIRYDNSGWTDSTKTNQNFSLSTGIAPHLEHIMLTGETVIDGPEIIWVNCFKEANRISTSNGYSSRSWQTFPHFDNIMTDVFRKILDGTVRIPTRQEVIDRTKVVIVNDVNSGNDDTKYSSPQTLFEGLYQMDNDGNYGNNFSFFKKTGRFPTIPTVYNLNGSLANSFPIKINRSDYNTFWPTIANKVSYMNSLFTQESTGDIYAGRHENGWVVYNPYKQNKWARGAILLKYNTCDSLGLALSFFNAGVIKETSNQLNIYLNNYDDQINIGMRTDTLKVYGSQSKPTYSYVDRATHTASILNETWNGGLYTLIVMHNGPLDITINCSGHATDRLTSYTQASLTAPSMPPIYTGELQYEGETFEYKNIGGFTTNGFSGNLRYYTGQGYVNMGNNPSAALRKTITVPSAGLYTLNTRYWVSGGNVNNVDIYINGTKLATPVFSPTGSDSLWGLDKHSIQLNEGDNVVEYIASSTPSQQLYIDNLVISPTDSLYTIQENEKGFCGVDGIASDKQYGGYTGDGYANTNYGLGTGINYKIHFAETGTKTFSFRYASTDARTAKLMINNNTIVSTISFPSTSSWNNWQVVTVAADVKDTGIFTVRLESTLASGLPNIDYLQEIGGIPASCSQDFTLPVILQDFAVKRDYNKALLKWNTLTEINNKGFDIERSNDSQNWKTISFVPSLSLKGNSSSKLSYSFTDNQPILGNNYYRLRQVDQNGVSANSNVELLSFSNGLSTATSLTVAPNPTHGILNVKLGDYWQPGSELRIFNSEGLLIYTKNIYNNIEQINTSSFSPGLYFIRVFNKKTQIGSVKFVKL